jgi:hypothetical protein
VTRAFLAAAALAVTGGHDFSVPQVQKAFREQTGLPLVKFASASTPEVTSLRTRPHETARFGEFQLFVLKPDHVRRLRRVFTHGTRPDRRGIHWVPDQAGGWIAVTLYERNLVVAWFPSTRGQLVDARWGRLQRAVATFAPLAKSSPPRGP